MGCSHPRKSRARRSGWHHLPWGFGPTQRLPWVRTEEGKGGAQGWPGGLLASAQGGLALALGPARGAAAEAGQGASCHCPGGLALAPGPARGAAAEAGGAGGRGGGQRCLDPQYPSGRGRPSWPQDPPGSALAAPGLFSEEADGDQEGGGEAGKGFRLPKSAGWALQ